MSVRQNLLELKVSLLAAIESLDNALALIPSDEESSGESDYESSNEENRYIPAPPPLVRQDGYYPTIHLEISDDEDEKIEDPVPINRVGADGNKMYKKHDYN